MTSIFDPLLPPGTKGVMQSIGIEAYADVWVQLAPDRTRLEGAPETAEGPGPNSQ